MRLKIPRSRMVEAYQLPDLHFPKYTTQLLNLANRVAQGTRPKVVGQMSELVPQYRKEAQTPSLSGWESWYNTSHPDALREATDKVWSRIQAMRQAMDQIDRPMVESWVKDLVITKTYIGLYYQQMILSEIAAQEGLPWRLATPEEEAQGVDGYVGERAYSVKPTSYQTMDALPETIAATMVYYWVDASGGLRVEVEEKGE